MAERYKTLRPMFASLDGQPARHYPKDTKFATEEPPAVYWAPRDESGWRVYAAQSFPPEMVAKFPLPPEYQRTLNDYRDKWNGD